MAEFTGVISGKKGNVTSVVSVSLPAFRVKGSLGGKKGIITAAGSFAFTRPYTISALFRTPHPRRLELLITGGNVETLVERNGAPFNPRLDTTILASGRVVTPASFVWSQSNSRYVLYFSEDLSEDKDMIQVIHHVDEVFLVNGVTPIGGFALLAKTLDTPDHSLDEIPDLPGFHLGDEMTWIYNQLFTLNPRPPE